LRIADPILPARVSDERYQPLPGIDQLPAWLWRRTGTRARVAIAGAVLLAIAMAIVLIPTARQAARDRAAAESYERAARRAQSIRTLQAEQRPRFGRSDPAAASRSGRAAAMGDLEAAIVADARRRGLAGPILRASCDPFPATVGRPRPEDDLGRRRGGYACLAITSEIKRTSRNAAGVLGHPYRAAVDFGSGRFAFCKVAGRPDPIPDPQVVTPKPCSS
jgi:hypothetical protein